LKKQIITFICLLIVTIGTGHAFVAPETLYLDKQDDLSLDHNGKPRKVFFVSNSFQDGYIDIHNNLEKRNNTTATLFCDGKKIKNIVFIPDIIKQQKINKNASSCNLMLPNNRGVRLVKDELAFPFLKKFHRYQKSCHYEKNLENNIDQLFLTNNYPHMGCAYPSQEIEVLNDSKEGLLVKIEALLGYKLSKQFIINQNPYAPLDFTNAPQLDAIFISTLLYRHDFTGVVLARLLEFHAKRGTLVNIIATEYMHNEKDKALFKHLTKVSPNIRIQEYKFHEKNVFKKFKILTNMLRDMHVKVFIILSSSNPQNNLIITGGRNIHDGFVFSKKPDFSKYPKLNQVDQKIDYAYWQDLEILIKSKPLAQSVYAQLLRLWNRQIDNQKIQPIRTVTESGTIIPKDEVINLNQSYSMIRHILSLPFNDGQALEKLYVEMIDKAQSSIKLSSPYLRPGQNHTWSYPNNS